MNEKKGKGIDFRRSKDEKEKRKSASGDKVLKRELAKPILPSEQALRMKKLSLSEFERYEENPFLQTMLSDGLSYGVRQVQELQDEVAYNHVTGEVGGALTIGVTQMVDRQQFVKVFTDDMATLVGLNPTAHKIFFVLMSEVQKIKNNDRVYLGLDLINEMIERASTLKHNQGIKLKPVGKTAYYKAIAELMAHDFLAPCKIGRDAFWVNPARLFNGSRIILGKQYIVADSERQGVPVTPQLPPQMDLSEASNEASPYESDKS